MMDTFIGGLDASPDLLRNLGCQLRNKCHPGEPRFYRFRKVRKLYGLINHRGTGRLDTLVSHFYYRFGYLECPAAYKWITCLATKV